VHAARYPYEYVFSHCVPCSPLLASLVLTACALDGSQLLRGLRWHSVHRRPCTHARPQPRVRTAQCTHGQQAIHRFKCETSTQPYAKRGTRPFEPAHCERTRTRSRCRSHASPHAARRSHHIYARITRTQSVVNRWHGVSLLLIARRSLARAPRPPPPRRRYRNHSLNTHSTHSSRSSIYPLSNGVYYSR
jgi:hypothetical protein